MKRSAWRITSKGKHIRHVNSRVRKETSVQSWTVHWSRCLSEQTHLTPRPEKSMGAFLPASVGFVDHTWWAWHISCCWKEVWSREVETAIKSQAVPPLNVKESVPNKPCSLLDLFSLSGRTPFTCLLQRRTCSPSPSSLFARCYPLLNRLCLTPTHKTLPNMTTQLQWLHH